jgi:hypothetical protein
MPILGGKAQSFQRADVEDTGKQILDVLEDMRSTLAIGMAALASYAYQEAALLPGRISEAGSVVSGQQTSKITTASASIIEAQTGDVEIIEGVYATVTGLSDAGIVGASLQLTDEIVFPFTLSAQAPQTILSPLSIPVQQLQRILTVTAVTGSYTSVSVVMWGHVAPARTRVVH